MSGSFYGYSTNYTEIAQQSNYLAETVAQLQEIYSGYQAYLDEIYDIRKFGAVSGAGVTQNTDAVLRAIEAMGSDPGDLYIPTGDFLIGAPLTIYHQFQNVRGRGNRASILRIDHSEGHGLRFMKGNVNLEHIGIIGTSDRLNGPAGEGEAMNIGVRWESADTAEAKNDSTHWMWRCTAKNVLSQYHASHSYAAITTWLSHFHQLQGASSKHHGMLVDRGFAVGRSQTTNIGAGGILIMSQCQFNANEGHAAALGAPDDADGGSVTNIRTDWLNCDFSGNDCLDGKAHNLAQVWGRGVGHRFINCGVNGKVNNLDVPGMSAISLTGRNHVVENIRAIACSHTLRVTKITGVGTGSITLDQTNVTGVEELGNQNPMVLVDDPTDLNGIKIKCPFRLGVTRIITPGCYGVEIDEIPQIVMLSADAPAVNSGNSGTTLVDIPGLRIPVRIIEKMAFTVKIWHHGGSTAGIKLGLSAPSNATYKWAPSNNLRVAPGGTIEITNAGTGSVSFGGSSNTRLAVLEGYIEAGSDADPVGGTDDGYLQVQYAQDTSALTDVVVEKFSSIEYKRHNNQNQ